MWNDLAELVHRIAMAIALILVSLTYSIVRADDPTLPVCRAEDEVIVMVDYPHPEAGYRCVHIDTLTNGRS